MAVTAYDQDMQDEQEYGESWEHYVSPADDAAARELYDFLDTYGLDVAGDWYRFDDALDYDSDAAAPDEPVDGVGDDYDVVIDEETAAVDETAYAAAGDEDAYVQVLEDGPQVYGRYLEDGNGNGYMEFAEVDAILDDDDESMSAYDGFTVVRDEMPSGLHGWTRPHDSNAVHVNKALYKVDAEKTTQHEIEHQRNPHLDELTIRYINGDKDVKNTLSFQADNVGKIKQAEYPSPPQAGGAAQYLQPAQYE